MLIQSLIKASNILSFLKSENREFTIAEISEEVKMPPSTAHRILRTLIKCDYVQKDEKTHLYSLGAGLIPLGIAATSYINPQKIATKILKNLSKQTLEDSFLVIKSGKKGLVISKSEGNHSLKIVENFGLEVDLHCGAVRKTILAFQSDEFIEEYINSGLHDYLSGRVDTELLRNELLEIREKKYAISNSEYIKDAIGIGAPVFNYNGELLGSIGIVMPKKRYAEDLRDSLIEAVKASAIEFSRNLGYEEI